MVGIVNLSILLKIQHIWPNFNMCSNKVSSFERKNPYFFLLAKRKQTKLTAGIIFLALLGLYSIVFWCIIEVRNNMFQFFFICTKFDKSHFVIAMLQFFFGFPRIPQSKPNLCERTFCFRKRNIFVKLKFRKN